MVLEGERTVASVARVFVNIQVLGRSARQSNHRPATPRTVENSRYSLLAVAARGPVG